MKKIVCILSLSLLPFAQIALSDDVKSALPSVTSATENSAVASPSTSPAPAWAATSAPVRRLVEKGVPNFGKLNAQVWRSGQPTREGYKTLAAQGLKTVVNLRKESETDKDLLPKGVQYFYIPITDNCAPTEEQGKEFLKIVSDPKNWPVLVHCKGGEGRAGVMAALVRHSFDGWKYDQIMREVSNFRITHFGLVRVRMVGSQQSYIRNWAEKNPAAGYLPT